MKTNHVLRALLILTLVCYNAFCWAQGPQVDVGFSLTTVYTPGRAYQITQAADGTRLVLGDFHFAAGSVVAMGVTRLVAGTNQVDQVFVSTTASLQGIVDQLLPLPNGKVLLVARPGTALTVGAVTRTSLLRLNVDGTPDAGFNAGTAFNGVVEGLAVQPDGKLVATGAFTQVNGQPASYIARLDGSGSLDAGFQLSNGGLNGAGKRLALQTDGKIIVAGSFTSVSGQPANGMARLLPSGALDSSFAAPARPANAYVAGLALQPDGKVVVATGFASGTSSGWLPLIRLLSSGATDGTFQTGSNFNQWFFNFLSSTEPVVVQADGKILVGTEATSYNGLPIGRVARLLPSGALDTTFSSAAALSAEALTPSSLQLLGNGQILLNTALLNADGSRDNSFALPIQNVGQVHAVVRQADGKLIVGGNFNEINGLAIGGVARLLSDGSPDMSFTGSCNGVVRTLALQPDGKLLVGGQFSQLDGTARTAIGRLLPTGALDPSFVPGSQPIPLGTPTIRQVALQPDGQVLLLGQFNLRSGPTNVQYLARLNGTTGLEDLSYQPTAPAEATAVAVQPDGKAVAVGQAVVAGQPVIAWRMLTNGQLDPSFLLTPSAALRAAGAVALDASGRVYVGGYFAAYGGVSTSNVARLLPSGAVDPGFVSLPTGTVITLNALTVQPNGRLLVGGGFSLPSLSGYAGTRRLLADGSSDGVYASANGPSATVEQLLVQPDGAIVAVGAFTSVNGMSCSGLTRLLDTNVLPNRPAVDAHMVAVWPVPARDYLDLSIDQDAHPQQVSLLDIQGRTVLVAVCVAPTTRLNVSQLARGSYFLRISFAAGTYLLKQIQLE